MQLQFATRVICNTCNLQHIQFALHAICNMCNCNTRIFQKHLKFKKVKIIWWGALIGNLVNSLFFVFLFWCLLIFLLEVFSTIIPNGLKRHLGMGKTSVHYIGCPHSLILSQPNFNYNSSWVGVTWILLCTIIPLLRSHLPPQTLNMCVNGWSKVIWFCQAQARPQLKLAWA